MYLVRFALFDQDLSMMSVLSLRPVWIITDDVKVYGMELPELYKTRKTTVSEDLWEEEYNQISTQAMVPYSGSKLQYDEKRSIPIATLNQVTQYSVSSNITEEKVIIV